MTSRGQLHRYILPHSRVKLGLAVTVGILSVILFAIVLAGRHRPLNQLKIQDVGRYRFDYSWLSEILVRKDANNVVVDIQFGVYGQKSVWWSWRPIPVHQTATRIYPRVNNWNLRVDPTSQTLFYSSNGYKHWVRWRAPDPRKSVESAVIYGEW